MFAVLEGANEETKDRVEEALAPPNRINPATGLPYGWDEDDELANLDSLIARPI